jgi:hypothetical protein
MNFGFATGTTPIGPEDSAKTVATYYCSGFDLIGI